jgi:hypothetical protein
MDARARALALLALICVSLLASASDAEGQTGNSAGSAVYTFGSALSASESDYTLYYSLPQVIHAGVKANMTFYVYVTLLSGFKIQSQTQVLRIIINTPSKQVTTQQVQNEVTLYQGGRWGPFNMTFDLTDSQAGLSPGQLANATVFANLTVYEAYDNPAAPFVQDAGSTLELATVQIAATPSSRSPSGDRVLASLAVGAVVVAVLGGVGLAARRKSARPPTRGEGTETALVSRADNRGSASPDARTAARLT